MEEFVTLNNISTLDNVSRYFFLLFGISNENDYRKNWTPLTPIFILYSKTEG